MERRQYKALNFDLDTKALERYYPSSSYRQAYRDIRHFLQSNGFEHRQWSGYRSEQAMSDAEITLLITRLNTRFPWLSKCVNRFDVTNIGKNYDLSPLFTDISDVPDLLPDIGVTAEKEAGPEPMEPSPCTNPQKRKRNKLPER